MMRIRLNRYYIIGFIILVLIIILLVLIFMRDSDYAAKIGDDEIGYSEVDKYAESTIQYYRVVDDEIDEETIRKDSLDQLIERQIIESYAAAENITVSEEELQTLYTSRVDGFTSEEKLLTEINRLYGLNKDEYLDVLSYDLLRNAVQNEISKPLDEWLQQQKDKLGVKINL